jgi:hypothetical protein
VDEALQDVHVEGEVVLEDALGGIEQEVGGIEEEKSYEYDGGELNAGEIVFVDLEKYEDFPQIGEVCRSGCTFF